MVSIVSLQAGHPFKLLNARSSQSLLCTRSSLTCCSSLAVRCSPWAHFWRRAPSNRQKILHQLGLLVFRTCRERRRGPRPGGQGGAVESGARGRQVYLMHSLLTEFRIVYLRYIFFKKKKYRGSFVLLIYFFFCLNRGPSHQCILLLTRSRTVYNFSEPRQLCETSSQATSVPLGIIFLIT